MRSATVEEAKEHLEELIAAAHAGETVEITSDGSTVASLIAQNRRAAHEAAAQVDWGARTRDLEQRGMLAPSSITEEERTELVKQILADLPPDGPPSGVLAAVLEELEEGW